MSVDCIIEDSRWSGLGFETLAGTACHAALAHVGLDPNQTEISLLAEFRDKPSPTNVLSWPSEERGAEVPGEHPHPPEDPELGDIAIAYETCLREAEAAGRNMADHVTHLLVHGTLHLLGYDHIDDKDAALMEALEVEILGKLGISDPYGD